MAGGGVTVLVLAHDASGEGLVAALGDERAGATRALLMARARAWAVAAFGAQRVSVAGESSFEAALAARPELASDGPVVLVAPELPAWRVELASALLEDLDAGCAAAVGPIFDGGLYVLALADPGSASPGSFAELDLTGRDGMSGLFTLAAREGWEVGLLRAERALRRSEDVAAVLADPRADGQLRHMLG